MVLPKVLLKVTSHWLLTCHKAARKVRSYGFLHRNPSRLHQISSLCSSVTKCPLEGREDLSLVCDFQGTLLRSASPFPFFMLVAFEAGGLLRALLLMLSFPLLLALGQNGEASLRIMVFVTFFGLRTKDAKLVARAVLPKFYSESLHLHAYEVLASTKKKEVITSMPRIMVEGFLKEYLSVDRVVASELQVFMRGRYFTGLMSESSLLGVKQKALKDFYGEVKADVCLVSPSNPHDHLFVSYSKEAYVVNKEEPISGKCSSTSTILPRDKYPKPIIFHDGRLAFFPTPSASLALFLYLPLGFALTFIRITLGVIIPYQVSLLIGALTGVRFRVGGCKPNKKASTSKGVLYVCTHRTLLDPVMLSAALERSVPAVTYSLSRMSEMIAPVKTVRLTRDRERDAKTMKSLLEEGDLAVCPEGTTCREPYLLRFSPLFTELADEMEPVALDAEVKMFYGTTASGYKWLDPVMFMMNPMPGYKVEFLGRVPREMTRAAGWSSAEVANMIQRRLADALGFECTGLTRRDKYMMLAGNEGVVGAIKGGN
ncbi:glycerol-3-phosphate acyltransferase 1-like [Typha latifolia]|uniref:glycerol-3-phosphate acyltransferase 1-like n=1 Tax=Typha latifolia TaxID=4733 RepID=UPI003C2DFC46